MNSYNNKEKNREKRQTALHIMVSVSFCGKLFFNRMPNLRARSILFLFVSLDSVMLMCSSPFQYIFHIQFFFVFFFLFIFSPRKNVANYIPSTDCSSVLRNNAYSGKKWLWLIVAGARFDHVNISFRSTV